MRLLLLVRLPAAWSLFVFVWFGLGCLLVRSFVRSLVLRVGFPSAFFGLLVSAWHSAAAAALFAPVIAPLAFG